MLLPAEIPEEQRRTRVYRHPDRELIEALLRRGKTAEWIAKWLEKRYPVEDEFGAPLDEAEENERRRLTANMISTYRARWLPECRPGVDAIIPELEDRIGRRLGAAAEMGPQYELDVLETVIVVAQQSLGMALDQSKDLEMLAGITLEAQKGLLEAVRARFEIAQSLGVKGYEAAPTKQVIKQEITSNNKNLNVDVNGVVDPRTGQVTPVDTPKVAAMKQLLAMDESQRRATVEAAERVAREAEQTFDGTAEDA